MINQILSHAYAAIALLAMIISVDLVLNFKKPLNLKVLFFLMSSSIFTLYLSRLLDLHYFVTEISRTLIMLSGINIISVLYSHKLKKDILYLSYTFFVFVIFLLLGNYYAEMHHNTRLNWVVRILRALILMISLYLFVKQHMNLFRSLKENTYYSLKVKKWTSVTILIFTVGLLNNFASIFLESQVQTTRSIAILVHLSICLFLLYRPTFLNRTELNLTLGNTFRKKIGDEVNSEDFISEFYSKTFFIKKDASLEELAKKLHIGPHTLNSFIYETTKMNFSDLVNKSRVDYFITLVESQEYSDYTIDALSELTGFGTRQTLYRNFKKFHGGNPSDLFRSVK
jgi:AraC-like DNA-binding protein